MARILCECCTDVNRWDELAPTSTISCALCALLHYSRVQIHRQKKEAHRMKIPIIVQPN